jgi:single-stranded-DNA-specific exonuclease
MRRSARDLLSLDDEHEALVIAARLSELNDERQRIELAALEEAVAPPKPRSGRGKGRRCSCSPRPTGIRGSSDSSPPACASASTVRSSPSRWQPDGTGTGSGRSMPGVDLGAAVIAAVEAGPDRQGRRPRHGGGRHHPARPDAGVSRACHRRNPGPAVVAARAQDRRWASTRRSLRAAPRADFVRDIERAGPFGAGNPAADVRLSRPPRQIPDVVGAAGTSGFTLTSEDGARLKAIAFRAADTPARPGCCSAPATAPCISPAASASTTTRAARRFRFVSSMPPGRPPCDGGARTGGYPTTCIAALEG